jgi:hypothetical protein
MKVIVKEEVGIVGKNVEIGFQELLLLADLKDKLKVHLTRGEERGRDVTQVDIVELGSAIVFLEKILGAEVISMDEAAKGLFTHSEEDQIRE